MPEPSSEMDAIQDSAQTPDVGQMLSRPTEARHRLFETLAEVSDDAIVIGDLSGLRIIYANRAAHRMFGCDPDGQEMLGQSGQRFWPEEDWPILEALLPQALSSGWTGDVRQRRLDGSLFDANATVFALPVDERSPALAVAVIRDISERKRIESDLKLTQFAMDRSVDAIYLMDPGARFLYVNDAVCRGLGYSRDALLGMCVLDVDPDVSQAVLDDNFAQLRASECLALESRHRRQDGSVFPVEIRANYLRVDGREYNCCFVRDITERKRAEDELKRSRQRLRELINAVPDALFAIDNDGVVTVWNGAMEAMSGVPREQVLGRGDRAFARALYGTPRLMLIDLVSQPDPPSAEALALYDVVRREGDVVLAQVYLPSVYGGRGAYVWGKAAPLRDAEGTVVGALEIIRDITEQKEAEKALRLSEARLRSVVSNAPVLIFELDDRGRFRLIEGRGLKALGLRPDELVASCVAELFEGQEEVQPYLERAIANEPVQFTASIGRHVFETFLNPVKDPESGHVSVIGVAVDVTERTEREAELRQRTDELTRFTYTVSHDLKSPLVTIRTFLGFLEEDLGKADAERVAKDLGFIRNAAERMSRLLDELLELSRIGRVVNLPTEFSLQALADEVLDLAAGRIVERGVSVEVTETPVLLRADRPRMVEVLLNLVDNAVKFMGDQPEPLIRIQVEEQPDGLCFLVSDNGAGIDPRYIGKVFGLFEKLDAGGEGTGIGLTLVQRIIEVHGGRIWVESAGVGQGTAVYFTLPGARLGGRA